MAYDEHLADRIAQALRSQRAGFEEKKMFGGLCFLVHDKMCLGIVGNQLMARIDPADYDAFVQERGVGPMTFSGKEMKGFLYVQPEAVDRDEDLALWVKRCLDFNPQAKSSKAKKAKSPVSAKKPATKPVKKANAKTATRKTQKPPKKKVRARTPAATTKQKGTKKGPKR